MNSIALKKRTAATFKRSFFAAAVLFSVGDLSIAQNATFQTASPRIVDLFADNTGFEGIQNVPVPRPSGSNYTTFNLPLQTLGGSTQSQAIPTVLSNPATLPTFAPAQPTPQISQEGTTSGNNFTGVAPSINATPAQVSSVVTGSANPLQVCVQSCTVGLANKNNYAHHCLPMCLAYAPFSANANQMNWQSIGNQAAAFLLQRTP